MEIDFPEGRNGQRLANSANNGAALVGRQRAPARSRPERRSVSTSIGPLCPKGAPRAHVEPELPRVAGRLLLERALASAGSSGRGVLRGLDDGDAIIRRRARPCVAPRWHESLRSHSESAGRRAHLGAHSRMRSDRTLVSNRSRLLVVVRTAEAVRVQDLARKAAIRRRNHAGPRPPRTPARRARTLGGAQESGRTFQGPALALAWHGGGA